MPLPPARLGNPMGKSSKQHRIPLLVHAIDADTATQARVSLE
jgi:hypothetical protein